jgi:hypothetical protein
MYMNTRDIHVLKENIYAVRYNCDTTNDETRYIKIILFSMQRSRKSALSIQIWRLLHQIETIK